MLAAMQLSLGSAYLCAVHALSELATYVIGMYNAAPGTSTVAF